MTREKIISKSNLFVKKTNKNNRENAVEEVFPTEKDIVFWVGENKEN